MMFFARPKTPPPGANGDRREPAERARASMPSATFMGAWTCCKPSPANCETIFMTPPARARSSCCLAIISIAVRGSAGVIDWLLAGDMPAPIVALRGNHEATLLDFLAEASVLDNWRRFWRPGDARLLRGRRERRHARSKLRRRASEIARGSAAGASKIFRAVQDCHGVRETIFFVTPA